MLAQRYGGGKSAPWARRAIVPTGSIRLNRSSIHSGEAPERASCLKDICDDVNDLESAQQSPVARAMTEPMTHYTRQCSESIHSVTLVVTAPMTDAAAPHAPCGRWHGGSWAPRLIGQSDRTISTNIIHLSSQAECDNPSKSSPFPAMDLFQ